MQVILCNGEHPEYGSAAVPLPIPDGQYAQLLEQLRLMKIGGIRAQDCYMDQILDAPPVLDHLEGTYANLDELDFLARSIDRFWGDELDKFQAMAFKLRLTSVRDLINLSFCSEQATVITDFSRLEEVGKNHYLTIHGGGASKEIFETLNGIGIAKTLIAEEQGAVTPFGVVYDNGMCLETLYQGQNFPVYADRAYLLELEMESAQSVSEDHAPLVLFLPIPELRLERLLARAGLQRAELQGVGEYHSELPRAVMDRLDISGESLFELNRLCSVIREMDTGQLRKLSAAAEFAEPEYAVQMRHLAENLDLFSFIPDIRTAEEYGQFMIRQSGQYDYDEDLEGYYDYRGYGEKRIALESGAFNEYGYISYHGVMSVDELMMEEPEGQQLQGLC